MRGERDILYTPDGELRLDYPSEVEKRGEIQPEITIKLIKSGLVSQSSRRQATYGILGDPGR